MKRLTMDACELCKEYGDHDCKRCNLGNPCIGCADYDMWNDICKSNGACGSSHKNWKETDCEVKAWIHSNEQKSY